MKYKVVDSFTDEKSGKCGVTIQTKYGHFKGLAKCHPDDMNVFSMYAGDKYAELRALQAYGRERYKQEKIKLKTLKELYNDIEHFLPEEMNSKIIKRINFQIRDCENRMEDYEYSINSLEETLNNIIEMRDKILLRTKKDN